MLKDTKMNISPFINVFNIEDNALILQTDGGALGNPGIGGFGGVIYINNKGQFDEIDNFYGPLGQNMTNNMAEIIAFIIGI